VDALPRVLKDFVLEGAAAIPCDPAQIALPVLVACSSAIGMTRRIMLKRSWKEPALLWGAAVMPSGSRKTPVLNLALAPLRDAQARAFTEHRKAMQEFDRAHETWKKQSELTRGNEPRMPICERFIVSDITLEALTDRLQSSPRGLLCERDELSGWINSFNQYRKGQGGDVGLWLSMHSAGLISVDRKGSKPIFCPYGFVALTGGIQPGILARGLTAENMENGLAARILMAMPPATKSEAWSEQDMSDGTKSRYAELIAGLQQIPMTGQPGEFEPADIPLSAAAKEHWIKFYNEHNAVTFTDRESNVAAMWSKIEGYCARLALIISTVRAVSEAGDSGVIDAQSMLDGITLARWFGDEARRVYSTISQGDDDGRAELIECIQENGGCITPRELSHRCRRYRKPGTARAAIDKLAADGLGAWNNNRFCMVEMEAAIAASAGKTTLLMQVAAA
jgi:hypothetical protein